MLPASAGINLGHGLIKMRSSREILDLNLSEARDELELLQSRIRDGLCDDAELAVRLKGVFWHLRAAWNGRELAFEDIDALSTEAFEMLGAKPVELPGTAPI